MGLINKISFSILIIIMLYNVSAIQNIFDNQNYQGRYKIINATNITATDMFCIGTSCIDSWAGGGTVTSISGDGKYVTGTVTTSGSLGFNETRLNSTIDARDTDTYNTTQQMIDAVNTTGFLRNWSYIDTYNTSLEMRKAVNETKLNGTNFFDIQWTNIKNVVVTWASVTGKPFTTIRQRWLFSDSGTLTINETTLNATIDARERWNTTQQIIDAVNSTNLLINWSGKGDTYNTTSQMINAVNNTALNLSKSRDYKWLNIISKPFSTLSNWFVVKNNVLYINTTTLNATIDARDTYNTTSEIITAANTTGFLRNWTFVNTNTWNTSQDMINAVNNTALNGSKFQSIDCAKISGATSDLCTIAMAGSSVGGGWTNNSVRTYTNFKVGINEANPNTNLEINGNVYTVGWINASSFCVNGVCYSTFGNSSLQMITAVNSTGLLRNWSSYDTNTGNTTSEMILAVNTTGFLRNWSGVGDTYNTTQEMIDAVNSTGLLINWNTPIQTVNNTLNSKINTVNSTLISSINLKLNITDQRYNDSARINTLNLSKLNVGDQRYNETNLINLVNTSANIKSFGFNLTTELKVWFDNLYYGISNPLGFLNKSQTDVIYYNKTYAGNRFMNITDQRYNDTVLANQKSLPGTCGSGEVVQNTTTTGVQCVTDKNAGNTTSQIILAANTTGFLRNWSYINTDTNLSNGGTIKNHIKLDGTADYMINYTGTLYDELAIYSDTVDGSDDQIIFISAGGYEISTPNQRGSSLTMFGNEGLLPGVGLLDAGVTGYLWLRGNQKVEGNINATGYSITASEFVGDINGSNIRNMDITCVAGTYQTAINFTDESVTCSALPTLGNTTQEIRTAINNSVLNITLLTPNCQIQWIDNGTHVWMQPVCS